MSQSQEILFHPGQTLGAQPTASLGVPNPIQVPISVDELRSRIIPTRMERIEDAVSRFSAREKFLSHLKTKGISPLYYYQCGLFDSVNQNHDEFVHVHNAYHCSSYNCTPIVHPPIDFFVSAENAWKFSCLGYFIHPALNSRYNIDIVERFMSSRFGSWGFKFIDFDESGFFYFKFDNEEITNKVISLGPVKLDGVVFVFGPLVNKYPAIKYTMGTCLCWVKITNIPRLYWSTEGLTYIAQALGAIGCKDIGYTWPAAERNEPAGSAEICLEISLNHSRPKHVLVLVPGIEDTFTHAKLTIEYLDRDRVECSLCSSPEHPEGKCPHRPGFDRDYDLMDCSEDPLIDLSEDNSSSTASGNVDDLSEDNSSTASSSKVDHAYTCARPRVLEGILSQYRAMEHDHEEDQCSNMQVD